MSVSLSASLVVSLNSVLFRLRHSTGVGMEEHMPQEKSLENRKEIDVK